jgi:hypothetical protein
MLLVCHERLKFYGEGDKLIGEFQKRRGHLDPARVSILV